MKTRRADSTKDCCLTSECLIFVRQSTNANVQRKSCRSHVGFTWKMRPAAAVVGRSYILE
jgi:hypothetical protein